MKRQYLFLFAIIWASLYSCSSSSSKQEGGVESSTSETQTQSAEKTSGEEGSASLSYTFEGYDKSHGHQGENVGAVSYTATNAQNAMLRMAINTTKLGVPFTITVLGEAVADKDNLPNSFTKTGKDDQQVIVSIPIEVEEGTFKMAVLTEGKVSFSEFDLEKGVFKGTITGQAEGALSTKSPAEMMADMQENMKNIDPNDQEALKEAIAKNATAMKEAQEAASQITVGEIKLEFSLSTKSVMVVGA